MSRSPCSFAALLAALILIASPAALSAGPADQVDPFIGTGGHGHTHPAATLPFGLVQLGPDTRLEGWDGCSGYHYTDDVVYGFSHTHLSGTGISDYGDILVMPLAGPPHWSNGYRTGPDSGYASRFDKSTERAEPGYYAVELADYRIDVELTATERTGLHRYRFPRGKPAHVLVDLEHRDRVVDASLRVVSDHEIEGHRRSTGWARDQHVYFVARFSQPFQQAVLAQDDTAVDGAVELEGRNVKARLSFGDRAGKLLVKVGLSSVDVEGARRNLEAELPGWDFDATRRSARRVWNDALGRFDVSGGTAVQRTIFYTALYHSLIAPNVWSDVDGRYRGMDGEIHVAQDRRHYTVFSLWDTFRATHPLYTLIEPERTREFVETFLAMYEQGGRLPVWELAANETDTMIGYHSVSVIADAYAKGIRDFDAPAALAAMVHDATLDHFGLDAYQAQGFIGSENVSESVSRTLEYAYDDWCIAQLARALSDDRTAGTFERRSQAWRHLFDPETGFMRARRNQRWVDPFDPRRVDVNYTEANAWQYSFFVPQDVEGLIESLGGEQRFVERLDELFETDSRTTGRDQPDISGLIGQYAHGNEPSHHMALLYHYAGRPDRSAERVGQILDTLYSAQPDGLAGNEDCGQMSSWYVLAATGLYPVAPCSDEYVLVPPLFGHTRLALDGGRSFDIRAPGAGSSGRYVQSALLNGKPLERSYLRHAEIAAGGELRLKLGPRPGRDWGVRPGHRPNSRLAGDRVLAAPLARAESDVFRDSLVVELVSADELVTIHYVLSPDPEGSEWRPYREPLVLTDSTTIQFAAYQATAMSPAATAHFHKIPNDWTVEVATLPAPQYDAGGIDALIDGLRGDDDWRTGGWHGYRGSDLQATVDLGRVRPILRAGASFLQDVRSWIWMPRELVVEVSVDGRDYEDVARAVHDVSDEEGGMILRDIVADTGNVEARWVRVTARGYGTIPDWHPGHGEAAWIFVDEMLIEPAD